MMRSLDVSQCAGDMDKPIVNSTRMRVCGIGQRNVFELVAFAGAGELRSAMNPVQKKEMFLCLRWSDVWLISATRVAMTYDHVLYLSTLEVVCG